MLIINLIIIIIEKVMNRKNKMLENILTMFIYSFSIIILMYPIADEIHFLIATLIAIITAIYVIGMFGKKMYNRINYNTKEDTL